MRIDWEIILKSYSDSLSKEEETKLDDWLDESKDHRNFYNDIKIRRDRDIKLSPNSIEKYKTQFTSRLDVSIDSKKQIRKRILYYAASLILPLMIGAFFIFNDSTKSSKIATNVPIISGGSKAILVTSKGEQVLLDSDSKQLLNTDGVNVKSQDESLIYSKNNNESNEERINKLIIPRGGEYKLVLADGTKVWLNAATELSYPVFFKGKERKVFLKGEAYFEVTHDKDKPFIVDTKEASVKVYGTAFNVNTQIENKVQTALVKGSVSFKIKGHKEVFISPSQMAELNIEKGSIYIKKVDVENYIAWKNGNYIFENETLESILNKLSLWYDVEVFFVNKSAKDLKFSGYLKKYESINKILDLIQRTTHVKFEIRKKVIYVRT